MARQKLAFMPPPRILTMKSQVASLLGRSENWFRMNRDNLEDAGFPREDSLLGGWDMDAICRWLDNRAGLAQQSAGRNTLDELLEDGQGGSTLR